MGDFALSKVSTQNFVSFMLNGYSHNCNWYSICLFSRIVTPCFYLIKLKLLPSTLPFSSLHYLTVKDASDNHSGVFRLPSSARFDIWLTWSHQRCCLFQMPFSKCATVFFLSFFGLACVFSCGGPWQAMGNSSGCREMGWTWIFQMCDGCFNDWSQLSTCMYWQNVFFFFFLFWTCLLFEYLFVCISCLLIYMKIGKCKLRFMQSLTVEYSGSWGEIERKWEIGWNRESKWDRSKSCYWYWSNVLFSTCVMQNNILSLIEDYFLGKC